MAMFGDRVPSDMYALALPLAQGNQGIALLVFLGTLALTLDMLHNHALWLAFSLFYLGRFAFLYPYMAEVRKKCISS